MDLEGNIGGCPTAQEETEGRGDPQEESTKLEDQNIAGAQSRCGLSICNRNLKPERQLRTLPDKETGFVLTDCGKLAHVFKQRSDIFLKKN